MNHMGTFHQAIEVGDLQGRRFRQMDALVDTGASYTLVPAGILRELGISPHDHVTFVLADGRQTERKVGRAWTRVDGREEITLVVFGDEGAEPLLGAYALEGLRLSVDPFDHGLAPTPRYLMTVRGRKHEDRR